MTEPGEAKKLLRVTVGEAPAGFIKKWHDRRAAERAAAQAETDRLREETLKRVLGRKYAGYAASRAAPRPRHVPFVVITDKLGRV